MLRRGHAIPITAMVLLLAGACGGDDGPGVCRFKSIAARVAETYGVSPDGGVWAWGSGPGRDDGALVQVRYSDAIVAVTSRTFLHACEEHVNGTRICWPSTTNRTGSVDLSSAAKVSMSLGYSICILGQDGTVACRPENEEGPGVPPLDHFRAIDGLGGGVVAVALGSPAILATEAMEQGCAIKQDHSLWCWGVGILGDGMPVRETRSPPIEIEALRGMVEGVAMGESSTCVVMAGGTVACWGPIVDPSAPALVPVGVPIDARVVEISMGDGHACALTDEGHVWCWGNNDNLQTGAVDPADIGPHQVRLPGPTAEVRAGYSHSCARRDDASVRCWGDNRSGQLGDVRDTRAASSDPVTVVGCP